MLIQTITKFDNYLDAVDSLEGLKKLPGFCYGYITAQDEDKFEIITIMKCQSGTPGRAQKHVVEVRSGVAGLYSIRAEVKPKELGGSYE